MDDRRGSVRALRVALDGTVGYRRGIHAPLDGEAVVWMLDPEMPYVACAADVALLELAP